MVDFAIGALTGDLAIYHGRLSEATGKDEIVQRVRTRLSKQLGEWRYNLASGVPWMDYGGTEGILGSRSSTGRANVILQDVVRNTDGVTGMRVIQSRFDSVSRNFTAQMEVETIYGTATITI
jgi:hypothetical protein